MLVLAALVGVVAYGATATLRHCRARARSQWRRTGARILEEATTTASLLDAAAQGTTQLALVSEAVRRVGANLDRLVADAPNDEAKAAAADLEERLRSVLFDVEVDVLLREANPDATTAVPIPGVADPELVDALAYFRRQIEQPAAPTH